MKLDGPGRPRYFVATRKGPRPGAVAGFAAGGAGAALSVPVGRDGPVYRLQMALLGASMKKRL